MTVSTDPPPLPVQCDVLVIGAGPAGSACAQLLASAGIQTLLVDQSSFPRDKTCGDGLIPDSHAAFERLGVLQEVMAVAQTVPFVRCVAPTGRSVDIPSTLAVLPRLVLDHILVRSAQRAGATLATPWRFDAFLKDKGGRVCGGRFKQGGQLCEVRANQTVLATGASAQALSASELCEQSVPDGFGLRGYIRSRDMIEKILGLEIVWHPRMKHGYGWIFPCGDGLFNIGVGYWAPQRPSGETAGKKNLHDMLQDFSAVHPVARHLMQAGVIERPFKGAPLRVSLSGTQWSAPGVLVTGEAAGSTYHFTGEGIGKAMETGMLAAEALIAARQQGADDAALAGSYAQALNGLKPKYGFYEKANWVNAYPWLAEVVIRRAAVSERTRKRLSHLLAEKAVTKPLTFGRVVKGLLS